MARTLFVLLFLIVGCSPIINESEKRVIIIRGSDTMLALTKALGEKFSDENSGIQIRVYGGGTSTGIKDLLGNKIDICTASRDLTSAEAKLLAEYYGSIGMYYLVAKDAVCIYVNKENINKDFSKEELFEIFTGKVKNWKSFDGSDKQIIPVIRPESSGTRKFFSESILNNQDFSNTSIELETTSQIVDMVSENINAIGFGGLGNSKNVSLSSVEGIAPTKKNIKTEKYLLTRYLHFFTSKSVDGTVKKFIDWVLSPEGQKIVKEFGFVPLWEINY